MVSSKNNDKSSLFVVLIVCVVALVAVIGIISSSKINYLNGLDLDSDVNIGGEVFSAKNLDSSKLIKSKDNIPNSDIISQDIQYENSQLKELNDTDFENLESLEEELYAQSLKLNDKEPKKIDMGLERTEIPKNLQNTRNNPEEDPANKYEYNTGQDFFDSLLITSDGFAYLSRPFGTFTLTEDIDFSYTLVLEGIVGDLVFDCNGYEIDGLNFENENPVLLAQQNVIIKNCKVKNRELGYELISDSRIETSTFDRVKYGIALNHNTEADECYVDGQNFVAHDRWVGFVLRDRSSVSNSEIHNINIQEDAANYVQVFVGFYVDAYSYNSVLTSNSLHHMNLDFVDLQIWKGFYVDWPGVSNARFTNNAIHDINSNFLVDFDCGWYGIYGGITNNALIEEVKIYDNSVNFNHFNANRWKGIYFWAGENNLFQNNEIYANKAFIDSALELMEPIQNNVFVGLQTDYSEITNNHVHDNEISPYFNAQFDIGHNEQIYNINSAIGIKASYESVVYTNEVINNLDDFIGIYLLESEGYNNIANYNTEGIRIYSNSNLHDSTANYNVRLGIRSYSSYIYDSEANYNIGTGINAYDDSHIYDSVANYNGGTGMYIKYSKGVNLEANYNHRGISVGGLVENTDYNLIDSHANHNSYYGVRITRYAKANNVESNFNYMGFRVENSALVENGRAYNNWGYGFYLEEWELEDSPPMQVYNSISEYNGEHGFYAEFGGLVTNSISRHNNESGFLLQGLSSAVNCDSYLNKEKGYVLEENASVVNSSASMNEDVGFVLSDFSFVSNSLAKGNFGGGFVLNNNASSFGIEALQNQGNGLVFNDNATGFISEAYNNSIGSHIEPNATITHSRFCDNGLDFDANFGTTKIELVATSTQGRWYGVKNLPCECEVICPPEFVVTWEACYGTPYYFFNFINIEEKKNVCCIPEGFILEVVDPDNCIIELVPIN